MENSNLRLRLENYEFDDEQELKLTLELLNRIEKDIESIKSEKSNDGYTISASIAGFAGSAYLLFGELNKLTEFPFIAVGSILLAMLLIGKLSWTIFQLVYIDSQSQSENTNRFRWTNHYFYDQRLNLLYQITIFILSIVSLFFLNLPILIVIISVLSFAIYIFLLVAFFILSYKDEPFLENKANKLIKVGLPVSVIITSIISSIFLLKSVPTPIGNGTLSFVIAGMIFAMIFFFNIVILLSSPSFLLTKLQQLRRDIIFLKLDLKDAWILYEIYLEGNELSEEVQSLLEKITYFFNGIEFFQKQQVETKLPLEEAILNLEKIENLKEKDFETLNLSKANFLSQKKAIDNIYSSLNPLLNELQQKINKISRATQEWEKANNYHQYILNRLDNLGKEEIEINSFALEIDSKVNSLRTKLPKPVSDTKEVKEIPKTN
jgi:hypothetical protein